MINFERFTLSNGMRLLVHEDETTPMAAVNILYNVGAKDEDESRTGFAHLFEHLMFGGSANAPNFDEPLQRAGGTNNAFTNNDITNYYDLLPAVNLETAFWLESDRLLQLDINERSLDVQRKVVCEEFKENYLNQPYGDIWHKLSALAYTTHPYKWPTIGKELSHVEDATLENVQSFFNRYYRPDNAIMVVSGGVKAAAIKDLAEKWFGDIPAGGYGKKELPKEPVQAEPRTLTVEADVPQSALYMAWHMGPRLSDNYYVMDLVSDLLSNGNSSRLYRLLVRDKQLFTELDAYVTGFLDEGLFIAAGRLKDGVSMETAEAALSEEIYAMAQQKVDFEELQKVKNKHEAYSSFSDTNLLNRTINLAFSELLGDANLVNTELDRYRNITVDEVLEESAKVLRPANCSTLYYHAKQEQA